MGTIIETYKLKDLIGQRIIDFIPPMRISNNHGTTKDNVSNYEVMERWKEHFKSKGISYIVLKDVQEREKNMQSLWKKLETNPKDTAHKICDTQWLTDHGYTPPKGESGNKVGSEEGV